MLTRFGKYSKSEQEQSQTHENFHELGIGTIFS